MFVLVVGTGSLGTEFSSFFSFKRIPHILVDQEMFDITNEIQINGFLKSVSNITHVVNCSGYTDVVKAEVEQGKALAVNQIGVGNLAKACKRYNKPLIHFSTDYVYGGHSITTPALEDSSTSPVNFYGNSKLKGEEEIINVQGDYRILRIQNLFSAFGPNFLTKVHNILLTQGSVNVINDQFIVPCSTLFVVSVVFKMLLTWGESPRGIYNLTHDDHCTPYDFARAYFKLIGPKLAGVKKSSYKKMNFGVVRPNYPLMDCSKIKEVLKVDHLQKWEDDLRMYYNHYGQFHFTRSLR